VRTYICENCGRTFEDYPSNRKVGKTHSCSRKCKGELQTRRAKAHAPVKTTSVCVRCGQEKPVSEFYKDKRCRANGGIQYTCKLCTRAIRAAHYDKNRQAIVLRAEAYQKIHPRRYIPQDPVEAKARALLNRAIQSGKVVRPDRCQQCGKKGRIHGHHWHGYDDPFDVIWLCPSCHAAAHGRGPRARAIA